MLLLPPPPLQPQRTVACALSLLFFSLCEHRPTMHPRIPLSRCAIGESEQPSRRPTHKPAPLSRSFFTLNPFSSSSSSCSVSVYRACAREGEQCISEPQPESQLRLFLYLFRVFLISLYLFCVARALSLSLALSVYPALSFPLFFLLLWRDALFSGHFIAL